MSIHFPKLSSADQAQSAAPLSPIAVPHDDEPTCTLSYVCYHLGRSDYGDRRRITYVRKLVETYGFPKPLPTLSRGCAELTQDVVAHSRWLRAAVDQWLRDFLPPEAAAGIDAEAKALAAAEMDAAAQGLGRRRGHVHVIDGGR